MITQYALVIDAGSSHSEVILFTWSKKYQGTGFVRQISNCEVSPGIDGLKDPKETVGNLLECVRKLLDKIPDSHPGPFPLLLGATAGMRIQKLKDEARSSAIFTAIRRGFENFSYKGRNLLIDRLQILPDTEEGLFAWITANYLLKYIPPEAEREYEDMEDVESIGILDMGGASAQIAFQTNEDPSSYVQLFGENYGVKSYSNLCFGSDQAAERYRFLLLIDREDKSSNIINNPCSQNDPDLVVKGSHFLNNPCLKVYDSLKIDVKPDQEYIFRSTDYDANTCRHAVAEITDWDACDDTFTNCPTTEEEPIHDTTFYALSSFYFSLRVLPTFAKGSDAVIDQNRLLTEIDDWCKRPYDDRVAKAGQKHAHTLCFKQNFIYYTLNQIYNLDDSSWKKLHFTNKIDGATLGWTLGYTLRRSNTLPIRKVKSKVSTEVFKLHQQVKDLINNLGNSNEQSFLMQEEELANVCEKIASSLQADILFQYEECGTLDHMKAKCCKDRFGSW